MGENSTGKSTLIKVLNDLYPRDGGQITVDGSLINPHTPQKGAPVRVKTGNY